MGIPGWAAGTRPIRGYRRGNDTGDPWAPVPFWHPCRWFGLAWYRLEWVEDSIGGPYDGEWHYQTNRQRARDVLKERCDDKTK